MVTNGKISFVVSFFHCYLSVLLVILLVVVRNGDLFVQNISISDFFPFVSGFLPFYILYFILFIVFATAVTITKAERLANFFHCRIRTNQPACWPFCTTSEWIWIFVPVAPAKRYHPSGSWMSRNTGPDSDVSWILFRLASLRFL